MAFSSSILKLPLVKGAAAVWNGFAIMSVEPEKPRPLKRIGTHSGTFHCDEALGCYMLRLLPEFKDSEIVRTRDIELLETCDVVLDVGGLYDYETKRFDHHQRSFNHTLSTVRPEICKNKTIKLSSAGLIYAHYGMRVIAEILKDIEDLNLTEDCLKNIFLNVYDSFVEEIDAIDNGVPIYESGKPQYRINTHIGARVHKLNPEWNTKNAEPLDDLFAKAIKLVGKEFTEFVVSSATVWWPARHIVAQAVKSRESVHISGTIAVLPEFCPWMTHLFSLEEEYDMSGELKFVVFADSDKGWRVRAIPVDPESFVCRIFLHEQWRGLREEELSTISGINGCIFCHATGFIGGHRTREGAIEMAVRSLKAGLAKGK